MLAPLARGDQDVRRLDVPMHEPARVRCGQRRGDLGDDARRATWLEPLLLREQRPEVGPLDEAHREVERTPLGARVEDRDDVRMIQRGGEAALALEARAEHAVAGEVGREHLQRDRPIERHVRRAVDDAHPSPPGHCVDAVAREGRADAQLVFPVRLGRRRGGTRRQPRTQAGIDVGAAGGGCAHRVHELRVRRLLEHEAARAARAARPARTPGRRAGS